MDHALLLLSYIKNLVIEAYNYAKSYIYMHLHLILFLLKKKVVVGFVAICFFVL